MHTSARVVVVATSRHFCTSSHLLTMPHSVPRPPQNPFADEAGEDFHTLCAQTTDEVRPSTPSSRRKYSVLPPVICSRCATPPSSV